MNSAATVVIVRCDLLDGEWSTRHTHTYVRKYDFITARSVSGSMTTAASRGITFDGADPRSPAPALSADRRW